MWAFSGTESHTMPSFLYFHAYENKYTKKPESACIPTDTVFVHTDSLPKLLAWGHPQGWRCGEWKQFTSLLHRESRSKETVTGSDFGSSQL